jgi:hypothetical protein
MPDILTYFPGQEVTIFLDTKLDGYLADADYLTHPIDGYNSPVVNRIFTPTLDLSINYPQPLIRIDTGLYYYKFRLPTGAAAVGSYLIDIEYRRPSDNNLQSIMYQVICSAPFGLYSVSNR